MEAYRCAYGEKPVSDCPIKVIHGDQEHLLSLSSDEVALLLDLCFVGACSVQFLLLL